MRLFNLIVLLCTLLSIDTHADKVRLQGRWGNGPQEVTLTYTEDVVTQKVTALKTSIDPVTRRFEFIIEIARPTVLHFQNQPLLVLPGDTISVDIAGHESNVELSFGGDHSAQHSFLIRLKETLGVFTPSEHKIDLDLLQDYRVSTTHHYDSSLLFLMNEMENSEGSKKFQKFAQGYLTALYYSNLLYPVTSGLIPRDKLPPHYFELVDFSFFKSADYLGFQDFILMLSRYNDHYYAKIPAGANYDSASVAMRIKSANHNFFGEIKDNLLLFIFSELTRHGTEINGLQIQTLYEYLTGVFAEQTQRVADMQNMKHAYDIIDKPLPLKILEQPLKTAKGKTVALAQVLATNEVVYIVFWSTSCAVCLNEIPAEKKLMLELAGKPVKFIRISFDNDEKKWQKAVARMKIDSDQYLIPEGLASPIAQYIGFDELPWYLIMDSKGRLKSKEASRPGLLLVNTSELLRLVE